MKGVLLTLAIIAIIVTAGLVIANTIQDDVVEEPVGESAHVGLEPIS